MKPAAVKVVPKLLNFEQRECRIDIAQGMLTTFSDYTVLLKKVITGDASWVYGYDIKNKAKSMVAFRRTNTEKTTSNSVKCEGFAQCFLRLQWRGAS